MHGEVWLYHIARLSKWVWKKPLTVVLFLFYWTWKRFKTISSEYLIQLKECILILAFCYTILSTPRVRPVDTATTMTAMSGSPSSDRGMKLKTEMSCESIKAVI